MRSRVALGLHACPSLGVVAQRVLVHGSSVFLVGGKRFPPFKSATPCAASRCLLVHIQCRRCTTSYFSTVCCRCGTVVCGTCSIHPAVWHRGADPICRAISSPVVFRRCVEVAAPTPRRLPAGAYPHSMLCWREDDGTVSAATVRASDCSRGKKSSDVKRISPPLPAQVPSLVGGSEQQLADEAIAQMMSDELFLATLRADPEILTYLDAGAWLCTAHSLSCFPARSFPAIALVHVLHADPRSASSLHPRAFHRLNVCVSACACL
jgi:hypothetical protein